MIKKENRKNMGKVPTLQVELTKKIRVLLFLLITDNFLQEA